ncbi:beta-ketoacyl synthase N-terminal-like domain-containing protein [Streptomyces sp. 3214.6]|uniref:beta-ketoacyl synthase N-terminal-like domain-containing protein n=1 Tax=Streptomyces sp. 3214.6 TaxID=1882757 RepID=UPI0009A5DE8D|nr:beta-ketoacyl synthase N-terminal-like domain-containing protein [Streptomyces sp. 3214.6]
MSHPVISTWSATSPFGVGRPAFAAGVAERRPTSGPLDPVEWQVPERHGCVVPGFDVRESLGRKGTRMMNRVTGLTIATVGHVLGEVDHPEGGADDVALVLGTTAGSMQSSMEITHSSLTGARPYHVEPATIPYAVMNGAAGRCAIWHGLRGPNSTIAAGRPTGLVGLTYARRLLLAGRARQVLCGAAEEFSAARSWVEHYGRPEGEGDTVLGEGCAIFLVGMEPAPGTRRLASVLSVRTRMVVDGDWGAAVGHCLDGVLSSVEEKPDQVWAVSPSGAPDAAGRAEQARLTEVFGADALIPPVADLIGETHSASSAFQMASVLSLAEHDPAAAGRTAVITSVDPSGMAAAALLRVAGP